MTESKQCRSESRSITSNKSIKMTDHQEAGSGALGRPDKYHSTKNITPKNSGSEGEIWISTPPSMPPRDEPMNPKKL